MSNQINIIITTLTENMNFLYLRLYWKKVQKRYKKSCNSVNLIQYGNKSGTQPMINLVLWWFDLFLCFLFFTLFALLVRTVNRSSMCSRSVSFLRFYNLNILCEVVIYIRWFLFHRQRHVWIEIRGIVVMSHDKLFLNLISLYDLNISLWDFLK